MKSNRPLNPVSNSAIGLNGTLQSNLSSIDNTNVRRKIKSAANAQINANNQGVVKSAMNLNLSQQAHLPSTQPLVRKKTAREFAND